MTIARLTAIVEAVTGNASTAPQILRVKANLYALTSDVPDMSLTDNQQATLCCVYLRRNMRGLVRAGAEGIAVGSTLDTIAAAGVTAQGDV